MDVQPRLPWNVKRDMTPLMLADAALDFFTSMPQRIENTYQGCSIKENKTIILATADQCPGIALPEPNLLKLFRRKETANFTFWWNEIYINLLDAPEEEKKILSDKTLSISSPWETKGESLEGFKCINDCQNCYGEDGAYKFPNAVGYDISVVPTTTTYGLGRELPWIRKENWDKDEGVYRPRCECELSYRNSPQQKHSCKGKEYKDNTMVCELVRNGGILDGCHEGRFVVSGTRERDGDSKCFLVEINLQEVEHHLKPGCVEDKKIDYPRQCVEERIGRFIDSEQPVANRSVPSVQELGSRCLSGWSKSEMSSSSVLYCKKDHKDSFGKDSFDKALEEMSEKKKSGSGKSQRRLLLSRKKAFSRKGRQLLQKGSAGGS